MSAGHFSMVSSRSMLCSSSSVSVLLYLAKSVSLTSNALEALDMMDPCWNVVSGRLQVQHNRLYSTHPWWPRQAGQTWHAPSLVMILHPMHLAHWLAAGSRPGSPIMTPASMHPSSYNALRILTRDPFSLLNFLRYSRKSALHLGL